MSCLQVAAFRPQIGIDVKKLICMSNGVSSVPCITTARFRTLPTTCLKLTISSKPKNQRCPPICVFGDSNQESTVGDSGKKLSLEEILRKQIERQEDSGEGPPSDGGGGRGRGGGGGDDSDGSEEPTPAEQFDELLQVILATLGLISLYAYILHGPEITRLGKDYFRFLISGSQSVRLKRAMYVCERFWKALTQKKKKVAAEDSMLLLQQEILNTPTWFDNPSKYRRIDKSDTAHKVAERAVAKLKATAKLKAAKLTSAMLKAERA